MNQISELKKAIVKAAAFHDHARRCKKPLGECKLCKLGMDYFETLPAHVLSHVLEEPRFR